MSATLKVYAHHDHVEACSVCEEVRGEIAWRADVPLMGPDAPENDGSIDYLIGYLFTVRERFGNTRVKVEELKWGSMALDQPETAISMENQL